MEKLCRCYKHTAKNCGADFKAVVPKLLPLMEVGLKTMKVLNGAAKMGRMFGIPLPVIPQGCVGTVESLVDGLGAGESGYACVAEAAGEAVKGSSGEAKTALSQFQLAEFRKFESELTSVRLCANLKHQRVPLSNCIV